MGLAASTCGRNASGFPITDLAIASMNSIPLPPASHSATASMAVPPAEAQIAVSYAVSEGRGGNTAGNRKWVIRGVSGLFGVNPDPITGGEDPSGWLEQRRKARLAIKDAHALVNAVDIEEAARALPGLEVARARMLPPQAGT